MSSIEYMATWTSVFEGRLDTKMKITKRQLRRIIRESLLKEETEYDRTMRDQDQADLTIRLLHNKLAKASQGVDNLTRPGSGSELSDIANELYDLAEEGKVSEEIPKRLTRIGMALEDILRELNDYSDIYSADTGRHKVVLGNLRR